MLPRRKFLGGAFAGLAGLFAIGLKLVKGGGSVNDKIVPANGPDYTGLETVMPWSRPPTSDEIHEWLQQRNKPIEEFQNRHLSIPYAKQLELDYSALRGDEGYQRAPKIYTEHVYSRDGDGPGRLIIMQPMPTRVNKLHVREDGRFEIVDGGPGLPEYYPAATFNLHDPYQTLIADLLVRAMYEVGVLTDASFLRSWNQRVVDAQMYAYKYHVEEDPDEPFQFIRGEAFRCRDEGVAKVYAEGYGSPSLPERPPDFVFHGQVDERQREAANDITYHHG